MKRYKLMLPLFAVAVAMVLALAMKPVPKQSLRTNFDDSWFDYNGGNIDSATSYSLSDGLPSCSGSDTVCAVFVKPNGTGNQPDQQALDGLQDEISQAMEAEHSTTNVKLREDD